MSVTLYKLQESSGVELFRFLCKKQKNLSKSNLWKIFILAFHKALRFSSHYILRVSLHIFVCKHIKFPCNWRIIVGKMSKVFPSWNLLCCNKNLSGGNVLLWFYNDTCVDFPDLWKTSRNTAHTRTITCKRRTASSHAPPAPLKNNYTISLLFHNNKCPCDLHDGLAINLTCQS